MRECADVHILVSITRPPFASSLILRGAEHPTLQAERGSCCGPLGRPNTLHANQKVGEHFCTMHPAASVTWDDILPEGCTIDFQ